MANETLNPCRECRSKDTRIEELETIIERMGEEFRWKTRGLMLEVDHLEGKLQQMGVSSLLSEVTE